MHGPISDGHVQVWQSSVDLTHADVSLQAASVLSQSEHHRAARFHRDTDRYQWMAARIFLRQILGEALAIPAAELRFHYGTNGKPTIANAIEERPYFNLSHSQGIVAVAISAHSPVGIDVEPVRNLTDISAVAKLVLSDRERSQIDQLAPEQRTKQFFDYWTCKEAIVKAHGQGVGDMMMLDFLDNPVVKSTVDGWKKTGSNGWQVVRFNMHAPFVGAVAVTGTDNPVTLIDMRL